MFEKEEEDLEKEERTRKLEKVESRLKKEKRFGERRKKEEESITWIFMFTSVLPHLELEY